MDVGTSYSVICLISSIIGISLSTNAILHYKSNPVSKPLGMVLFCSGIFSFAYAFEIMRTSIDWVFFWTKIEYLGLAFLPTSWLWLCIVFTNDPRLNKKWFLAILVTISLFFFFAVQTNEYHHLYYPYIKFNIDGVIKTAIFGRGPIYYAYTIYVAISIIETIILYGLEYFKGNSVIQRRLRIVFLSILIIVINYLVSWFKLAPFGLDLAPVSLILSSIVISYGIFHAGFLDISPIARELVFETMQEGVIITDSEDAIVDFNPVAVSFLPSLNKSLIGEPITAVIPDSDTYTSRYIPLESKPFITENEDGLQFYDIRQVPVYADREKVVGTTWFLKHITQQHNLMNQLKHYAEKDELTHIWNRRKWIELARNEIGRANRHQHSLGLMLIDIDHFKIINDTRGHAVGDQVLEQFAALILEEIRESDLFGRLGGEEFAIVLVESDAAAASRAAERIREKIATAEMNFGSGEISITLSAGVAVCGDGNIPALEKLMRSADIALYEAKENGRNCVILDKESDDSGEFINCNFGSAK